MWKYCIPKIAPDIDNPAPPPVTTTMDEQGEMMIRHYDRGQRIEGGDTDMHPVNTVLTMRVEEIDLRVIPTCPPPELGPAEVFNILMQLDSVANPGITAIEFQDLFRRCGSCGMIMTRRVFPSHECVMIHRGREIIDLTMDDDT
jgi:hypothetical protein